MNKDFFEKEFQDFELEHMPHLRALLELHILNEFEGETDTDNDTLKEWFWILYTQGRELEPYIGEWVYSESRHQRDAERANNSQ